MHDYPGRSSVANPSMCDQYPVGYLGQKIGGVMGKTSLRTQGLSSSIPLTGPVSIINKPIAVLFENGSIWGCGLVEHYNTKIPHLPSDVMEYLDMWRGCMRSS